MQGSAPAAGGRGLEAGGDYGSGDLTLKEVQVRLAAARQRVPLLQAQVEQRREAAAAEAAAWGLLLDELDAHPDTGGFSCCGFSCLFGAALAVPAQLGCVFLPSVLTFYLCLSGI